MAGQQTDSAAGLAYAGTACILWGLGMPLYMAMLSHVPAAEIVAHRVIWALPCVLALLAWQGGLADAARHLRSGRTLALAALTAGLISVNWGTYVYAIITGQSLAAALGYYITPLVNVMLGVLFLGERPSGLRLAAIALAVAGVAILSLDAGGLPWISLVLALSFGVYGLVRKVMPVGATEGFALEVVVLFVPALALLWLLPGAGAFASSWRDAGLLVAAGPVTAIPLVAYAAGARRLRYATLGILFYIVPTLLFGTAVLVLGEPVDGATLAAFACIWSAVALYSASLLSGARRAARRPAASDPPEAAEPMRVTENSAPLGTYASGRAHGRRKSSA